MRTNRRLARKTRHYKRSFALFLLCVLCAGLILSFLRPLPAAQASSLVIGRPSSSVPLNWPAAGSAAIGIDGYGALATYGTPKPRPTASIAKMITTLAMFEKQPFKAGTQGQTITLTTQDVQLFEHYYAIGGSVVKVQAGEQITQYQALQAMLLPSANNMADTVAVWAFGSMDNYHSYATDMVKRLGLSGTTIGSDASGMSPTTLSTPTDLVHIGELAMANPVIADIVSQKSAVIPVQGPISSVNARVLGTDTIIGIKTGLTDEAGASFLFAAKATLPNDQTVRLIGVVMGGSSLPQVFKDTTALITSAKQALTVQTVARKGDHVATVTTPWMASTPVYAADDLDVISFKGIGFTPKVIISPLKPSTTAAGETVGTLSAMVGTHSASDALKVAAPLQGPTMLWRVTRYFN